MPIAGAPQRPCVAPGRAVMRPAVTVDALLPALNEAETLPRVLRDLQGRGLRRIVVVDNGSTDATAEVARAGGAVVVSCPERGYGAACLAGLAHLSASPPDAVVFLDADGSDDPDDLPAVLGPVERGEADLVIGSRVSGHAEPGALTPVQHFGNVLSCRLLEGIWGVRFTDLGPFRAVRWSALEQMQLADRNFGFTVEMQARAARLGLRCAEVPVHYRRRAGGQSKVAGTIRGSAKAGAKILYTIGREVVLGRVAPRALR